MSSPYHPEHELVPYQTSELPPGPWLVFAPHADDETYGMGGSLLKAAAAGLQTHVIVMTDGALGIAPQVQEAGTAAAGIIDTRRDEARRAAKLLGVSAVSFWDVPDRSLRPDEALISRAARAIHESGARTVFFPCPLELHPDHRGAAHIAWQALQRLSHIQQRNGSAEAGIPAAWGYEISVQSPINRLIDITAQLPGKQQAMAVYNSQNDLNAYPQLIQALDTARTYTLPESISHAEGFCEYAPATLQGSLREATEQLLRLYW